MITIDSPHTCTVESEKLVFTAQAQWLYIGESPYVVQLLIQAGRGRVVTWEMSHELLEEGLSTVSGLGDVRIWPDGELLCVSLTSPTGSCRLTTSLPIAFEFVGRIHDQAPPMYESQILESQIVKGLRELRGATS